MTHYLPELDYNQILQHASQLPQALEATRILAEMLNNQLLKLTNNRCNGSEHWRDANANHRKPKLYIIHPQDCACPIHGQPEPGKRIRTYVGTDPAKIEGAQEAIARNRHYNNTLRELQDLHRRMRHAHSHIQRARHGLGLTPPDDPDTKTPPAPLRA